MADSLFLLVPSNISLYRCTKNFIAFNFLITVKIEEIYPSKVIECIYYMAYLILKFEHKFEKVV